MAHSHCQKAQDFCHDLVESDTGWLSPSKKGQLVIHPCALQSSTTAGSRPNVLWPTSCIQTSLKPMPPAAMCENFWHYMKRAFDGLFPSGGPEGWVPLELASELWYLCPPSMMHSWHQQFGFTGFANDAATIAPSAWNYITITIPVAASMPWTPTPLELTGHGTKHQWHS